MTAQAARRFTLAELRDALEACLEANLRLVTTGLDHRLVLHQLAARILAGKAAPSPTPRRR
jgi:DNA polymerase-3 subunit delta